MPRAEWEADVERDAGRLRALRTLAGANGALGSGGATLVELEAQVWISVDRLLRRLHAINPKKAGEMPVPSVMLGLLPPPPPSGWPSDFRCTAVAAERAEMTLTQSGLLSCIAVDARYPPVRRAQRLSYAVWEIIGCEGDSTQPVVEAASVAERLTLALWWIDSMNDRVRQ
jgi:hypothetical protein